MGKTSLGTTTHYVNVRLVKGEGIMKISSEIPGGCLSSSSKFYFQQNTTMEQYQEKENTL